LLRWLLNEKREDGPAGFIGFAISARMSDTLHTAILLPVFVVFKVRQKGPSGKWQKGSLLIGKRGTVGGHQVMGGCKYYKDL